MKPRIFLFLSLLGLLLAGCNTTPTRDISVFRSHQPASILVLPPVNQSTDIGASYSLLTTVSRPLGELGYYVFPVGLVDRFMKENGCPTPNEMHQVPLHKLREIFGADAVLYITIEKYGTKYLVITSSTLVYARAKLVDTKTGAVLWQDRVNYMSGGNSGIIEALVDQVVNKLTDQAHAIAYQATYLLLTNPQRGIPTGPRHPKFLEEKPAVRGAQPKAETEQAAPPPPLRFQ